MPLWAIILFILCITAAIAWKRSPASKFYLKLTIYAILSFFFATAPIPLMLLNPRSSKNALFPAAGLRFIAKYILGLKCSVKGIENIVNDTGCVVLINHQSVVDLIVLAELWPVMERSTVISKKEIFYIWPFGLAAWLWGTIFIDRLNGAKAKDTINNTGDEIRRNRRKVLMFPEGTRSMEKKMLPFKKGAFHLAIASKSPVQPVVVSRYTFLGPKRFDDGEIVISILPPISTKEFKPEEVMTLMDKSYNLMQSHLNKFKDCIETNNNRSKSS